LTTGRHHFDEVVTIRVTGTVEKQADQLVAPTTSIPLVATLALFWEKSGIARDHALRMLREAITEAMKDGADKGEQIQARIKDVDEAIKAVKTDLIAKLPKAKRAGKVITKDLVVEVLPVHEESLVPAA
jgi:DNA primase large subunit